MRTHRSKSKRSGAAAIETLLVLASFVVATFVMMQLGAAVISVYFSDGNQLQSIPVF